VSPRADLDEMAKRKSLLMLGTEAQSSYLHILKAKAVPLDAMTALGEEEV
jgi:hypothetical protein